MSGDQNLSRRFYLCAACTQEEVNEVFSAAKAAQKLWARTPLCQRADILHRVASLMKEHAQPMADCLVKEVAKPAKDSLAEVTRAGEEVKPGEEGGQAHLLC